jgi:hypothetical protein
MDGGTWRNMEEHCGTETNVPPKKPMFLHSGKVFF